MDDLCVTDEGHWGQLDVQPAAMWADTLFIRVNIMLESRQI